MRRLRSTLRRARDRLQAGADLIHVAQTLGTSDRAPLST
jgi:hypothetical protein